MVARCNDLARTGFAILVQMIIQKLSCLAVVSSRYRTTAGYQQFVLRGHQITLRRHTGKGRTAMWLHKVSSTAAAIGPDGISGLGIDCVNKGTHKRPNAGRKVYLPLIQNRATPHGPHTDKPVVADHLVPGRTSEKLANKRSVFGIQAIEISVIRSKVELVFIHHRCKAHRAIGVETPLLYPCLRVIGGYTIRDH